MIDQVPETARFETKFVGDESHQSLLLNWVKLHPHGFSEPFVPRRVNNIYFDSHFSDALHDNVDGNSSRWKVRYRWYGNSSLPSSSGQLEVKCKRNVFGWKHVFPIDEFAIGDTESWSSSVGRLTKLLPAAGRIWMGMVSRPVLVNRYDRRYFVTKDNRVRVTVDSAETMFDQRLRPNPNIQRRANIQRLVIVEVKCDRADRNLAKDVIQKLPLRASQHSKFLKGMLRTGC